ncbi:hypothetical protein NBRC116602_28900 [Hyphomicrobiales bacterium 4NK60-0047b]
MGKEYNCIVCGGSDFNKAYQGRLGRNGNPPLCTQCGSVERHRIVYGIYENLKPITQSRSVLQFAPDCSVNKNNFKSYTGSVYDGQNPLDIKNTKLSSGSYDIVVSNHVFEHIDDDVAALKECIRLVGEEGFVHICVPLPAYFTCTVDWGYADKTKSYHYRNYGADMGSNFCKQVNGLKCLAVMGTDKVTGLSDIIFFFSKSQNMLIELANNMRETDFMCVFIS